MQSLAIFNFLLFLIFFTRSVRDLATSQSWLVSIWNPLDMNGRVTTFTYFVFFCFWEFLPTVLLLCLITSKAGGVGGVCVWRSAFSLARLSLLSSLLLSRLLAPRHGSSHNQKKLPDFGIFHIINSGDRGEGKLLAASPMVSSYGTASGDASEGHPRWTHGGDLFQDPLRYDSDDGTGPSPHQFPSSFNSDASSSAAGASYERRLSATSPFV